MHRLITCDVCRQPMRLPSSYAGRRVQCPVCGVRFTPRMEEPDLVEVELAEQPDLSSEPLTILLPEQSPAPRPDPAAEGEIPWLEPAAEEQERQAGPLRLRKSPKKPAKPGRWPVYLFLLAVLPLGLPLLATAA